MPNFSERQGIIPPPEPQKSDLRPETRAQLYNAFQEAVASHWIEGYSRHSSRYSPDYEKFIMLVRSDYLKQPLFNSNQMLPAGQLIFSLFGQQYDRVYVFLEFIIEHFPFRGNDKQTLIDRWNRIFQTEIIAYQMKHAAETVPKKVWYQTFVN
jgi:hypothetical protein